MSMPGAVSAAERSYRSVFVGNIPYEATEEQLKDIFSEVGPVISFRLVYDRDSGKPKGYGFCEYKDQDTAMSAMRNLNGYELSGRSLRVDNAANEKNKEELRNLQATLAGPPVESPYGPECDPDKAPEAISRAVASLPPEQMYELMKQMKSCIQNNPNEARNMLLMNPQLAYALLQAQVVMRIVDPQVAMGMLSHSNADVKPLRLHPGTSSSPMAQQAQMHANVPSGGLLNHPVRQSGPQHMAGNSFNEPPFGGGMGPGNARPTMGPEHRPGMLGDHPLRGPGMVNPGGPSGPPMMGGQYGGEHRHPPGARDFEMRGTDPRGDREMRMGGTGGGGGGGGGYQGMGRDPREVSRDPRNVPHDVGEMKLNFDPRARGNNPRGSRGPVDFERGNMPGSGGPPFDQRGGGGGPGGFPDRGGFEQPGPPFDRDPRSQGAGSRPPQAAQSGPPAGAGHNTPANAAYSGAAAQMAAQGPIGTQDQEKAALIMQVLQLSDQQIAMLPPEQRQSIMVLKEQIARSAQTQ